MVIDIPHLKLVNALNAREHWRERKSRVHHERQITALSLIPYRTRVPKTPCVVTITRFYCGRAREFDDDGLSASCKALRDEVARFLGVDDKPGSGVEWKCEQAKGEQTLVRIQIEGAA